MVTTFDGDNLLITLTAGGVAHEVDVQVDLYSDWKEWVKLAGNSKYPPAFRTIGGDPLTPGINAGAYYFIRNDLGWRIKPAEEDSTISLTGNLAPENSALPIFEPTVGAFTVAILGLQPITQSVATILTQQQSAAYNGQVAIDTINGVSGTSWPTGTATQPVNNLADAITIAATEGIRSFTLRGTITLNQSFLDWSFHGVGSTDSCIVQMNSQNVSGSLFNGLEIQGTGSGMVDAHNCHLDTVAGIYGDFVNCGFENNFTMGGSCTFAKCYSDVSGAAKPWLSMNGGAYNLGVRGYHGGLELRSISNVGASASIDGDAARFELASTCTAGTIIVGGVYQLTDSSAGSTITETGIEDDHLKRVLKATAYRQYTNPATGNLDIYNDADALDQSVPIFEDNGTTPWDGVGPIVRRNKIT